MNSIIVYTNENMLILFKAKGKGWWGPPKGTHKASVRGVSIEAPGDVSTIRGALKGIPDKELENITKIKSLSEDEFLKISGTTKRDAAFYHNKEIIINKLRFAMNPNKAGIIRHEVGHSLEKKYLVPNITEFEKVWSIYSNKLSGNQRYDISEGFAELYSRYRKAPTKFSKSFSAISGKFKVWFD